MRKFREHHIFQIFKKGDESHIPFDALLREYFRSNKAIGSKDRKEICETLYGMIRWKGLLDYLCKKPINWEKRFEIFQKINPLDFKDNTDLPLHVRLSFPKFLFQRFTQAYGEEKARSLCLNSNLQAPTTVRINSLKTSRETLLKSWQKLYEVSPCEKSPYGIVFHKKINFFALPEFKDGLFEIQDEASQLVADHMHPNEKDHVLDYCAGSGGKTLAFAPKMNGKGQIYLYDIRPHMLVSAKKRLKRAGIQNSQLLDDKKLKKKGMLKRMDWILLDVPCSGTGTLRRNPDMKWKMSDEMFDRLIKEQRDIFDKSLKFLQPNGKIVYSTCSILPEENEKQISYFIEKYNMALTKPPFLSLPEKGKMDGFFCAVLELLTPNKEVL